MSYNFYVFTSYCVAAFVLVAISFVSLRAYRHYKFVQEKAHNKSCHNDANI